MSARVRRVRISARVRVRTRARIRASTRARARANVIFGYMSGMRRRDAINLRTERVRDQIEI